MSDIGLDPLTSGSIFQLRLKFRRRIHWWLQETDSKLLSSHWDPFIINWNFMNSTSDIGHGPSTLGSNCKMRVSDQNWDPPMLEQNFYEIPISDIELGPISWALICKLIFWVEIRIQIYSWWFRINKGNSPTLRVTSFELGLTYPVAIDQNGGRSEIDLIQHSPPIWNSAGNQRPIAMKETDPVWRLPLLEFDFETGAAVKLIRREMCKGPRRFTIARTGSEFINIDQFFYPVSEGCSTSFRGCYRV